MGGFVDFMQSPLGRGLRIVVGLGLVAIGALLVDGIWGVVLAVVGTVPLIAGLAGVCFFAPFFGYTLTGRRMRAPTS